MSIKKEEQIKSYAKALELLHIGSLYEPIDGYENKIGLYFKEKRFELLSQKEYPKNKIYMYLGLYKGDTTWEHRDFYHKFLCGIKTLYMISAISYLKEIK